VESAQKTKEALAELLSEYALSKESVLYRATLPEHLEKGDGNEFAWISANPDPSEAVVNVYGTGHLSQASDMGPGLAFAEQEDNSWIESERVLVSLRLGDVLDQGGLVYPVESVIIERVWYLTLPTGRVKVRRLG
jgi:hypothetical protein